MSGMQELNLECQLAQVQIKRYLAGETLPEVLLNDLTSHIAECKDCAELAEQQKDELRALISPEEEQPAKQSLLDRLRALLLGLVARQAPESGDENASGLLQKLKQNKPVVLSCALAVVLIVMATIAGNPTTLFGPKVAAAEEKSEEKKDEASQDASDDPVDSVAQSDGSSESIDAENSDEEASTADGEEPPSDVRGGMEEKLIIARSGQPELSVEASPTQPTKQPAKRSTAPPRSTSSTSTQRPAAAERKEPPKEPKVQVTVYDSEGNPIKKGENQ